LIGKIFEDQSPAIIFENKISEKESPKGSILKENCWNVLISNEDGNNCTAYEENKLFDDTKSVIIF